MFAKSDEISASIAASSLSVGTKGAPVSLNAELK
jgi:hypothetical protein